MSQNYEYFGKYILLEKLATGGMAEVFLARAPGAGGIGKFVAIKRILPQFSDNPEFMDMFRTEAKIAVNLSHSNIVSIYEFGIEQGQFFLVMDYVEGRNLRQILNKMKKTRFRFSIDHIIFVIKEIAAGLDHAHRCLDGATGRPLNITHRDMSPQNVMISFEGEVKIVDFGIAKAETQMESTRTGTLKGKFGYMSPEQAEGQAVDLRTDVFSLGIVLWELLANDRLFIANNEINTLRKIRDCHVPSLRKINPNIHPELERICLKALSRDRNLRYQTAAALHRDLNRFLNRQYPDFSAQDFSELMKKLFSDELVEIRKRLVEYAQANSNPETNQASTSRPSLRDDKTLVTDSGQGVSLEQTQTQPDTHPGTISAPLTDPDMDLSAIGQKPVSVDNDQTPAAGTLSKTRDSSIGPEGLIDTAILKSGRKSRADGGGSSLEVVDAHTPIPRNTQIRTHRKDIRIQRSPFRGVLYTLAFLFGSYLILDTLNPPQAAPYLALIRNWVGTKPDSRGQANLQSQGQTGAQAPAPAQNNGGQDPVPPTPQVANQDPATQPIPSNQQVIMTSLVINSNPSGAEIFIAGKSSGKTTPARVEVPANRPFEVHLRKERYLDYHAPNLMVADLQGKSFNATLQRAMIGYLDVDVKPPHNVRLYINGQKLAGEQLPLSFYVVPAGTPVQIRAENPVTGERAEETVTLRQDERKSVVLSLKKNDSSYRERTPSQAR